MRQVEDSVAMFSKDAQAIFSDYAASWHEKESLYQGTTLLRNRVLNGLVEKMMNELSIKMNDILHESGKSHPDEYKLLKDCLTLCYEEYVSRLRNLNSDKIIGI